jgi:hypothetical protein
VWAASEPDESHGSELYHFDSQGKLLERYSPLSAGGVSDHFVTLMLRQGDAQVCKRYSPAKLNMMREALAQLDRQANKRSKDSGTALPN